MLNIKDRLKKNQIKSIERKNRSRFENFNEKYSKSDLLDSVKPIILFFRIFCVCPFTIVQNDGRLSLCASKGSKIHSAMLIILSLSLSAIPLRQAYLMDNERSVIFIHALIFVNILTSILNISVAVTSPLIRKKCFQEFYARLEKVDEMILSASGTINYAEIKKSCKSYIISFFAFIAFQIIIDNLFNVLVDDYQQTELNEKVYTWLYNVFWYINYICISAALWEMHFNSKQLALRMKSSQELLEKWIKELISKDGCNQPGEVDNFEVKLFEYCFLQQKPCEMAAMTDYKKILFTSNLHYHFFKMQQAIAAHFSAQLVVLILHIFILGAALFYYSVVITFVQLAAFNLIEVFQSSFWNVVHVFLLLLVTSSTSFIRKESEKFDNLIFLFLSRQEKHHLQGKNLALQIAHLKYAMSPFGLFLVDRGLITSLISQMTNYMFIMLQFALYEVERSSHGIGVGNVTTVPSTGKND